MDLLLVAVFAGLVGIGGPILTYQMMQSAARAEIEAWAKQKGHRLVDMRPGFSILFLIGTVNLDVTYQTVSGECKEAEATYTRTFGGLVTQLTVSAKGAFNYDRY